MLLRRGEERQGDGEVDQELSHRKPPKTRQREAEKSEKLPHPDALAPLQRNRQSRQSAEFEERQRESDRDHHD